MSRAILTSVMRTDSRLWLASRYVGFDRSSVCDQQLLSPHTISRCTLLHCHSCLPET